MSAANLGAELIQGIIQVSSQMWLAAEWWQILVWFMPSK
jgi:hypothetical protein